MQAKVTAEGEKEKDLYEKFMCYCKTGGSDLSASVSAAEGKVGQLPSSIEEAESSLAQLKEDLKQAQVDRSSAKAAMAEATALREKEAAAYAAEKADYDANIAALAKATASIEKGMSGAFLQTEAAQVLKKLVLGKSEMIDADREEYDNMYIYTYIYIYTHTHTYIHYIYIYIYIYMLYYVIVCYTVLYNVIRYHKELTAFLSGTSGDGYAPASGEITGILKQMHETMSKSLADATAAEEDSAAVCMYIYIYICIHTYTDMI